MRLPGTWDLSRFGLACGARRRFLPVLRVPSASPEHARSRGVEEEAATTNATVMPPGGVSESGPSDSTDGVVSAAASTNTSPSANSGEVAAADDAVPHTPQHVLQALRRHGLPADRLVETQHTAASSIEAAAALGVHVRQIAKSLGFMVNGQPVLVVASGSTRVDSKKLCKLCGVSRRKVCVWRASACVWCKTESLAGFPNSCSALGVFFCCCLLLDSPPPLPHLFQWCSLVQMRMATPRQCVSVFGFPPGALGPLGLRTSCNVLIDASLDGVGELYCGGGSSRHMLRLSLLELTTATQGRVVQLSTAAASTHDVQALHAGTSAGGHESKTAVTETALASATVAAAASAATAATASAATATATRAQAAAVASGQLASGMSATDVWRDGEVPKVELKFALDAALVRTTHCACAKHAVVKGTDFMCAYVSLLVPSTCATGSPRALVACRWM